MDRQPNRRKYLATLGALGVAGVAGCSQGDSTTEPTQTDEPNSNPDGANFTFEYDSQAQQVTIEYTGGAAIRAGNLQVRSSTGIQTEWSELGSTNTASDAQLSGGATAVIGTNVLNWGQAVGPNETIRLVFAAGNGPSTLGRFTPPEPSTLTSTVPPTSSPTPEVTETPSPDPDRTAPSISAFSLTNPTGQQLRTTFESNEALATIRVSISGAEAAVLTTGDFSERISGGTYTYEATYQANTDGEYTATLEAAADSNGNDGATGASVAVTITTTDGIIAQEQLISRWPLTENLADVVGNNGAEVVQGEPTMGVFSGKTATDFGSDVAVRVSRGGHGDLSLLGSDDGPFSIAMWVHFDSDTGTEPFEGTGTPSHALVNNDTGYRIRGRSAENQSGVDINFSVSPYSGGANGYSMPEGDNVVVSTREWHHLVVVAESENFVRIYVDGVEEFADNSMGGYNEPNDDFWTDVTIGSWYGGNPEEWANLFDGKMADLRIYDTGLSSSQIGDMYQRATPTTDSGDDSQTTYTAQSGLAYHDGYVYVVADGEILKINRTTNDVVTRFDAPSDSRPTGLAYGSGSLWFADAIGPDYDGKIVELNPDTGDERSSITSSWDPRGLAFGDESLWAVDITGNSIVEFSPNGERISSFDTADVTWGQGLAYFDGSLWLGNNCSGDGCTVSLREYNTDGTLIQKTGERSSSSTAPYGGLAATETELLGPGTDGEVTVLRTL